MRNIEIRITNPHEFRIHWSQAEKILGQRVDHRRKYLLVNHEVLVQWEKGVFYRWVDQPYEFQYGKPEHRMFQHRERRSPYKG